MFIIREILFSALKESSLNIPTIININPPEKARDSLNPSGANANTRIEATPPITNERPIRY